MRGIQSPSAAGRTAAERVAAILASPTPGDIMADALHTVTATKPGIRLLKDDLAELILDAEIVGSPVTPSTETLASKLHGNLDRVLVAAEIAERDGETMRQAIRKAFDVFDEASITAKLIEPNADNGAESLARIWESAARAMSSALGGLLRVHIESHEL